MQFYKKTSIGKTFNPLKIIIKLLLSLFDFFIIVILISKINFPSPNK